MYHKETHETYQPSLDEIAASNSRVAMVTRKSPISAYPRDLCLVMSFLFSLLVSRLQSSGSPTEREGERHQITGVHTVDLFLLLHTALVAAAAKHHVFTCQQLGECASANNRSHLLGGWSTSIAVQDKMHLLVSFHWTAFYAS